MDDRRVILTYTGKVFDFWEPTPEMFCIEDIAHALAMQNRFNGHTVQPYSVAEHCVRMSYVEDRLPGDPLTNLLHEVAEAYVGDIASPQKQYLTWEVPSSGCVSTVTFRDQESMIVEVIFKALDVSLLPTDGTKKADRIMLATEIRDLMFSTTLFNEYLVGVEPLEEKIYPWEWFRAEQEFLIRFKELINGDTEVK
ncbi:hypothetical protein LCGC14_0356050 [marine sediment metagenome]|uniref:HD domain-containing protein n=1 Tax=marine sediment metagenome TaxID=412755 RepID=A0A0F9WHK8_9ZZZZ